MPPEEQEEDSEEQVTPQHESEDDEAQFITKQTVLFGRAFEEKFIDIVD